jgi:hypothetical protein
MRHSRHLGAFVSGLALYSAAVLLSGLLAGHHLLGPYLSRLGGDESWARVFGEAAVYAVPVFVLALGWAYVTLRPYRRGRRPTTGWCLSGFGLAWLGWLFYGVLLAAEGGQAGMLPISEMLLSPLVPPLWGLLNALVVLCGVLIAGALARRHALLRGFSPR